VKYSDRDSCGEGGRADRTRRDGAKALGVTILREYAVGGYDIQILSAKQSDGLATYLQGEGYKLPEGAESVLSGYILMGMKFFVARVNLQRHAADKTQELEPLQISFRSPVFVRDMFPQFYHAMFDKAAGQSGAFLEYAWDMAWCDPCADDPLSFDELRQLGVSWVRKGTAATPEVLVTCMHIRYSAKTMFADLRFVETDEWENSQGRYILNHPFTGGIACDEARPASRELARGSGRKPPICAA
jgi:hypothetical protein